MKRRIKLPGLSRAEIERVAEDMYIYGYPLLLMDVIKRMQTATPYPTRHSAPVNQFAHERFLPGPHDKSVAHPNADCLTSFAWLDLRREPVVLSVPWTDRYYLLSFFSGWYEIFAAHSPRNDGGQGAHFGFVAPHWNGKLPPGVRAIVAPTETVWIHGWFEASGRENIELVHSVQDEFRLIPLSEWGSPSVEHRGPARMDVDEKCNPQEYVDKFDARCFYTRLSGLMEKNPVPECDNDIVRDFARAGFFPCEDFTFEMLPAEMTQAMQAAVASAQRRIAEVEQNPARGQRVNGWSLHTHPGRYQKNYLDRAADARRGIVAAVADDVLCFHTGTDHSGEPFKGSNQYLIDFSPDLIPPVNAFWSITLYDSRQHLVPNSVLRNAIGDRDRLRVNPDNSVSIHIQHDWPGPAKDSNWLPAPKEAFSLALKMYWPKPDAVAGSWRPPAVMRTK
jgi:hypothetical protein